MVLENLDLKIATLKRLVATPTTSNGSKLPGNDFDSSLGSQHDVSLRNFLGEDDHQHDDAITSVALRQEGAIDINKFNARISALLRTRGQDILRSKGILDIKGSPDRFVFQAVHMLMEGDDGKRWQGLRDRVLVESRVPV